MYKTAIAIVLILIVLGVFGTQTGCTPNLVEPTSSTSIEPTQIYTPTESLVEKTEVPVVTPTVTSIPTQEATNTPEATEIPEELVIKNPCFDVDDLFLSSYNFEGPVYLGLNPEITVIEGMDNFLKMVRPTIDKLGLKGHGEFINYHIYDDPSDVAQTGMVKATMLEYEFPGMTLDKFPPVLMVNIIHDGYVGEHPNYMYVATMMDEEGHLLNIVINGSRFSKPAIYRITIDSIKREPWMFMPILSVKDQAKASKYGIFPDQSEFVNKINSDVEPKFRDVVENGFMGQLDESVIAVKTR